MTIASRATKALETHDANILRWAVWNEAEYLSYDPKAAAAKARVLAAISSITTSQRYAIAAKGLK